MPYVQMTALGMAVVEEYMRRCIESGVSFSTPGPVQGSIFAQVGEECKAWPMPLIEQWYKDCEAIGHPYEEVGEGKPPEILIKRTDELRRMLKASAA